MGTFSLQREPAHLAPMRFGGLSFAIASCCACCCLSRGSQHQDKPCSCEYEGGEGTLPCADDSSTVRELLSPRYMLAGKTAGITRSSVPRHPGLCIAHPSSDHSREDNRSKDKRQAVGADSVHLR